VKHPNDDALTRLQADWPRWQIWIVYKVIGGPTWCARLHDNHSKIINADSPAHLAEALEDTVSEPIPLMDMAMTGAMLREMYPAWVIEQNLLGVWTAEQTTGSEVRYLVAKRAWELAAKIEAAEQAPGH
jgi:hypothetical protein